MVSARGNNNTSFIASIYLNKGVLYYELENNERALDFYLQAETLLAKLQEVDNMAKPNNLPTR